MADKEDDVKRVVVIDHAESARLQAERRLLEGEDEQLFAKSKVPGGIYKAPDGRFHNAHGDEVTEDGDIVEQDVPEAVEESDDWRAEMVEQRRESAKSSVGNAPITGESYLPPLTDEDEEDTKATKPRRRRKAK